MALSEEHGNLEGRPVGPPFIHTLRNFSHHHVPRFGQVIQTRDARDPMALTNHTLHSELRPYASRSGGMAFGQIRGNRFVGHCRDDFAPYGRPGASNSDEKVPTKWIVMFGGRSFSF